MDTEKMAKANHWLDKAIKMEEDGKSEKMITMALDKACALEIEAIAS